MASSTARGTRRVVAAVLLCLASASTVCGHVDVLTTPEALGTVGAVANVVAPEGFLLFCLCMGRLGNQLDTLIGALAVAKAANRTLVLPPFILYEEGSARPTFVPFESLFELDEIARFHRVVPLSAFMSEHGHRWKPRIGYCFGRRSSSGEYAKCNHKNGNPFGPFWNHVGVSFEADEYLPVDLVVRATANERADQLVCSTLCVYRTGPRWPRPSGTRPCRRRGRPTWRCPAHPRRSRCRRSTASFSGTLCGALCGSRQ